MLNGDAHEEPPIGRPEPTRRRSKSNISSKSKLRRRDHNSTSASKLAQSERGEKKSEKKAESIESLSLSFFEKVRELDETKDCSTIREGDQEGLQMLVALESREHTIREADPADLKPAPPLPTSSSSIDEKQRRRKRTTQTQRSSSSTLNSRAHRSQTVFEVATPELVVPPELLESALDALGQKLLAEIRGQQEDTRAALQAIVANQATIIQMLSDREELTQTLTKTQNVLSSVVTAFASPKQQAPASVLETSPQDALISSQISILNEETHRLKQRLRETSDLVTELQDQVEKLRV